MANFIPPVSSSSLGSYFCVKNSKIGCLKTTRPVHYLQYNHLKNNCLPPGHTHFLIIVCTYKLYLGHFYNQKINARKYNSMRKYLFTTFALYYYSIVTVLSYRQVKYLLCLCVYCMRFKWSNNRQAKRKKGVISVKQYKD